MALFTILSTVGVMLCTSFGYLVHTVYPIAARSMSFVSKVWSVRFIQQRVGAVFLKLLVAYAEGMELGDGPSSCAAEICRQNPP